MSNDLVKRLRWLQAQYENAGQILAEDFKDAADEIEEYERAFSNLHREYDARGDRIEELEAKQKKAAQYFAEIILHCANSGRGVPLIDERIIERCEDIAANAIEELAGGKDE